MKNKIVCRDDQISNHLEFRKINGLSSFLKRPALFNEKSIEHRTDTLICPQIVHAIPILFAPIAKPKNRRTQKAATALTIKNNKKTKKPKI